MRPSSFSIHLLSALLAALALAGWTWGWHEHRRAGEADFLQRRLAMVDLDHERLAKILADKQRSEGAAADQARRTEIEQTVETLRRLKFLSPVTYREIPRADLPAILRRKLAQQVPDQEFANTGISLAALGLLPTGIDLKKTYLDLLGEQIGAFYDQHSAELFTFSGQGLDNAQNRVILAHELTHALEDQHFQLARLPLEAKGNDDRALAASALVEGDATLVMSQYMIGDLSPSTLKDTLAGAFTSDMRQIAAAPRYLRETLLFPYLRGQEFCQALYQTGGWPALAEAFRRPPDNTAQVLHPERFLTRGNKPASVIDFPEVTLLGEMPIGNNVLGEFGVRQWLARWLKDEAAANRIATGWTADRYLVYGDAKATSYVWKTGWSSPEAATEFAEMVPRCWGARYGFDARSLGGERVLPEGRRLLIVRDGQFVTLVDAQDSRWESALRGLHDKNMTAKPQNDVSFH